MSKNVVPLSSIAEIIAGQSPESKYYNTSGEGLPFFQGKADFNGTYPTIRFFTTKATKIALPNDILLSVRAPVGPTNICNVQSCIGRGLAAIRPGKDLHYKYVYYFFKTIEERLAASGNGSTFSAITTGVVRDLQIPLPSLPTQKKIAAILDKADSLRQKDKQLLEHYNKLSQSIFYDMFGDPVRNEKGWVKHQLSSVCIQITDGTHFSPPPADSGAPYITAKHLKLSGIDFYSDPTYVSFEDHQKIFARCRPEKGDVLYIKDGATTGIAAINHYDFEFSMLSSLALIKPDLKKLSNYYLKSWLNHQKVKENLIRNYMAGAAIKRFTLSKINLFEIPLPPLPLQSEFKRKIEKIESSTSIALKSNGQSNFLFQSLLQKAFKGELVKEL